MARPREPLPGDDRRSRGLGGRPRDLEGAERSPSGDAVTMVGLVTEVGVRDQRIGRVVPAWCIRQIAVQLADLVVRGKAVATALAP